MQKFENLVINGKSYSVTQNDRDKCFIEDKENSLIIFIYDYKNWQQTEKVDSAYVCGSFNSWVENPDFKMSFCEPLSLQYVAVDFSKLSGTGNSGHPEYKFCINGLYISLADVDFVPEGFIFPSNDKNLAIIYSDENLEEIICQFKIAGRIKTLSDFDLTCRLGQEEISNFRLVPGTKKLFRSFHPFYSTDNRSLRFDTEKKRIEYVQKLAAEEGIKSDINLTDDYTVFAGEKISWYDGTEGQVEIPAYYQKIIDSKNVCNVMSESGIVPSYDYVYNKPTDSLFYEWVRVIVNFIIDDAHDGPFQIHCAIGTDRTGVFCALLGGFCGATWDEVCEDYQKTNRMGIREYRSKSMLARSFQKMLDVEDAAKIGNLQKTLWEHFMSAKLNGDPVLSEAQLEALVKKLN